MSVLVAFQQDLSQLRRYLSMFTGVGSQKQVRLKVKLHLSCQVLWRLKYLFSMEQGQHSPQTSVIFTKSDRFSFFVNAASAKAASL
jgi:hypothetical protein